MAHRTALDVEAVFREHHDFLWRNLRALGVSPDRVDDAVQEVFVVVHRRRADYRPDTPVLAWLFGIARRIAGRERQRHARDAARHDPITTPLPDRGAGLDDAVERRRAAERIHAFLDSLDDDQRAVFVLTEVEGMTAPQIAEIVGAELNTIYSRLRLARKRFERFTEQHRARQERRRAAH